MYVAGSYVVREAQMAEFLKIFAGICEKNMDFQLVEMGNQPPGRRHTKARGTKIHGF